MTRLTRSEIIAAARTATTPAFVASDGTRIADTAPPPFGAEESLHDAVARVLDEARILHYDAKSGETLEECRICGQWEEHASGCPVVGLTAWMEE